MFETIRDLPTFKAALAALSDGLMALPENDRAWSYTITGFDGDPYITRTLFPRVDGYRMMLHRIHREDRDRHFHNHPWATAQFTILTGGYTEQRPNRDVRIFGPGDVNELDASTLHRIVHVEPETWTLGLIGERVQDWGFFVDGAIVPWRDYFAAKGHAQEGAAKS